ncbi:hypothetical protein PoB_004404000 [Plakobranchus ocellatus]|uniref:Uncharacterized protein n=1 Tax=Plakobranchus ocellatus TaxID=259542 RepID=A0AAV4BEJ1_9GAST|nr:hypothetical protein PoB_004404000 [Plakobranchus ocellatus]
MKVIPRTAERKVSGAGLEGRNRGGTVDSESALRSAETILSRVRTPPPVLWHDGKPESLIPFCCGQAIYQIYPSILDGRCPMDLGWIMDLTMILCLK